MKQAWTLRDKKRKDFYAYFDDTEGSFFTPTDHPHLEDESTIATHLQWHKRNKHKNNNIELEAVEIQYTVIEK